MKQSISIFWFRQDLRLSDNPGLIEAARLGKVLPIYILDDLSPSPFKMGDASKIYLHHSLVSLDQSLNDCLNLYIGNPKEIIFQLIDKYNIKNIFWNRCYEPWRVFDDAIIEKRLRALKINYSVFNGSYLWAPEEVKKEDGSYYKVFSAYKRKAYFLKPRKSLPRPENLILMKDDGNEITLSDFQLIPEHEWHNKIKEHWRFGENAAQSKLDNLLYNCLSGYKKGRDYPAIDQTSKLSASLHFGEISPNQIWQSVESIGRLNASEDDVDHFLSEVIWREFSCYLMAHFKGLPSDNFQSKFNEFPWGHDELLLNAWKSGNTGYPIVDAGMRELWKTGYMHNRVRMIVASFLVKNLMIHWHYGRDWFWDCLVDADLANNSASWQWVAGSGVDAAPYFRIFNPITQGEKFDGNGDYTREFVPELKLLPNKYLFKPWEAPEAILSNAGVILGTNYPKPIVDIKSSRERALLAYHSMRS
ncbi:MAG: deoxyribodipyrimidine photo-lyase [Pseudomonadota bacterium]